MSSKTVKYVMLCLIFIAPAIFLALIWARLPMVVPVHFDLSGTPTRIGDKSELIAMTAILTFVNIVVFLLLTNIYRIKGSGYGVINRTRYARVAFMVAICLSAIQIYIQTLPLS